jgi:hypothetical protein
MIPIVEQSAETVIVSPTRPRLLLSLIIGCLVLTGFAGVWDLVRLQHRQRRIEQRRLACARLSTALQHELSTYEPLQFKNLPNEIADSISQQKAAFISAAQGAATSSVSAFEKETKGILEEELRIAHTFKGERRHVLEATAKMAFAESLRKVHDGAITDFYDGWPQVAGTLRIQMLHRMSCSS